MSDNGMPELRASVKLTKTCLTLSHGPLVGEFFLDDDGELDLWQIDDWISKLIVSEADKANLRNQLLGK